MRHVNGVTQIGLIATCVLLSLAATAQIRQVATEPWEGADRDAFDTVAPEAAGLDAKGLGSAARIAQEGGSDSLVVVRGGNLVLERYWNGKTANDVQQMYSATKSPFVFVVGRAIQKGYINSLEQPIVELVPEIEGKGREVLTFRNLLAMESGLEQSRALDEGGRTEAAQPI